MPKSHTNRKPADRLADVRAQIKELKLEEQHLREGFIAGGLDRLGDEYVVVVTTTDVERIDTKAIRLAFTKKELKPYLVTISTTYARTEKRHG